MIRKHRQALPPLLPTSFCQESTSMENTIIISSLHHTGKQNSSGGGEREMYRESKKQRGVRRERRTDAETEKEQRQDLSFNPFSHHAAWPVPVPLSKHTSNTLLAFRNLSMCVCLITCHSPQQPNYPRPGSFWLHTRAVVHTVMCLSAYVHVCAWQQGFTGLSSVALTLYGQPWLPPRTNTHTNSTIATQTTAVMVVQEVTVGSCMCVDWSAGPWWPDSLPSTFSQPCHLCCSAVTHTTMAAACEPARLPRTQRRPSQPLTSEAATIRPETSWVGSSVKRPETQIFSARLK